MKLYNLGSLNIDYVYTMPHFVMPGETITCDNVEQFAGGKGLNQSIAASAAGMNVVHIGRIGKDGIHLKELLDKKNVNTEKLIVDDVALSGNAIIQVNREGQNCIIISGGTNRMIDEEQIESALASAEKGDILLVQNETSSIPFAIQLAHDKGMIVAVNPAPLDESVNTWPLDLIDFFIVNEIEARELASIKGVETKEMSDDEILQCLHQLFPNTTIVQTLGERGSQAISSCGSVTTQPRFSVKAVDTTAAGDTFVGYFLFGKSVGEDNQTAMRRAAAASAICVSRKGAAPSIPSIMETEDFLKQR